MKKKCIRLEIRLTEDESQMFQNKAKRKIETMEALLQFYKKYQQQLSWLGGNFNQCMHRANELAIEGELNESYFRNILIPETRNAIQAIRSIKAELDAIHDKQEEA